MGPLEIGLLLFAIFFFGGAFGAGYLLWGLIVRWRERRKAEGRGE